MQCIALQAPHLQRNKQPPISDPLCVLWPVDPELWRQAARRKACALQACECGNRAKGRARFTKSCVQVVRAHGCQTVVDFGCGEGSWIKSLLLDAAGSPVVAVAGVDESPTALRRGCKRVLAAMVKHHTEEELRGHSVPAIQLVKVRLPCVPPQPQPLPSRQRHP